MFINIFCIFVFSNSLFPTQLLDSKTRIIAKDMDRELRKDNDWGVEQRMGRGVGLEMVKRAGQVMVSRSVKGE